MKYDPSVLIFDSAFALQDGDRVVRVPADVRTKDGVCAVFQRQLPVPAYFTTGNWDDLSRVLRFPEGEEAPEAHWNGRTVLFHQDIPLLQQDRYEARIYLEILIQAAVYLQQCVEEQEQVSESGNSEQLMAVFPSETREEIEALLREPPSWEAEIGSMTDSPHPVCSQRAPTWSLIQRWIERLDGITVDYVELSKEERCSVSVRYLHSGGGYYLVYTSLSEQEYLLNLLSSPLENEILTRLLSKTEVVESVKEIHEQGQYSSEQPWYLLALTTQQFEELARTWHYTSAEEVFVEIPNENVRWEILTGMGEAFEEKQVLPTINEWEEVLTSPEKDENVEERLTALCVMGRVNMHEISDLLLRYLVRSRMDERWVSARFLGLAHDERAVSVLCQMLTEAWDLHVQEEQETMWYFSWRRYAPRLLRFWQTQPVLDALFQALQVWLAADPQFDPRYDYWIEYEANLCYELGYRDAFDLVLALPLQAQHHTFLPISLAKGYFTRSRHIGFLEETHNRIHSYSHIRAIAPEMLEILEVKCHLSRQQAQDLFDAFLDEKNPISSYF